jgi:hypothetical protein
MLQLARLIPLIFFNLINYGAGLPGIPRWQQRGGAGIAGPMLFIA